MLTAPLTTVAVLLLAGVVCAQADTHPLAGRLGLTEQDLRDAERGVVARVLDTPFRKEVAAVAVARVRASRADFLAVADDPAALLRTNENVLAWDRLDTTPSPSDLARVAADSATLETLPSCAPGRCGVKLDAAALERLRRDVPWNGADAATQAAHVVGESLAARVEGYWRAGAGSLPPLADRAVSVDVAARTRELLRRAPALDELDAELSRHLQAFPDPSPGPIRDGLLWVRERFWRREVLSFVHVASHVPSTRGDRAAVAHLQIHANHYFEAALAVTAYVADERGAWLVSFQRFETDHRRGGFSGIERALVRRGARRRLEAQMTALRRAVDSGVRGPANASRDRP